MEIKAKLKPWGSSFGIIIPKRIVDAEKLLPEDEVIVEIRKKEGLRELFGSLPEWKIDTQKMKDELRKGWE